MKRHDYNMNESQETETEFTQRILEESKTYDSNFQFLNEHLLAIPSPFAALGKRQTNEGEQAPAAKMSKHERDTSASTNIPSEVIDLTLKKTSSTKKVVAPSYVGASQTLFYNPVSIVDTAADFDHPFQITAINDKEKITAKNILTALSTMSAPHLRKKIRMAEKNLFRYNNQQFTTYQELADKKALYSTEAIKQQLHVTPSFVLKKLGYNLRGAELFLKNKETKTHHIEFLRNTIDEFRLIAAYSNIDEAVFLSVVLNVGIVNPYFLIDGFYPHIQRQTKHSLHNLRTFDYDFSELAQLAFFNQGSRIANLVCENITRFQRLGFPKIVWSELPKDNAYFILCHILQQGIRYNSSAYIQSKETIKHPEMTVFTTDLVIDFTGSDHVSALSSRP